MVLEVPMSALGILVLAVSGTVISAALYVVGKIVYDYFKGR